MVSRGQGGPVGTPNKADNPFMREGSCIYGGSGLQLTLNLAFIPEMNWGVPGHEPCPCPAVWAYKRNVIGAQ